MIEKLKVLFNVFGGKENLGFVLLIALGLALLFSPIKNRVTRLVLSLFGALFLTLQLCSLFFTNSFISYSFFVHFNIVDVSTMLDLYVSYAVGGVFVLAAFVLFLHFFYTFLSLFFLNKAAIERHNVWFRFFVFLISFMFIGFVANRSSVISDIRSLASVLGTASDNSFEETLKKMGFDNYIIPEEIKSSSGKNLIVISLESFERGFIDGSFSEITPNLNRLKNSWSYIEVEPNSGSDWTSGSLYASLTGLPAFFGIHGNSIFKSSYRSKITSLGHVLNDCGYDLTYMNGNTNFSGVKDMVSSLKFNRVIDYSSVAPVHKLSSYGLRDKDLFEIAKQKVQEASKASKPFAIYLSTTDTHFPDGIYDSRMEKFVTKKGSDFEFMISAVDYLVGDFISFLKNEKLLEDTVVFIYPDHLKMGDTSMLDSSKDRGLYLLTNASVDSLKLTSSEKTYQVDLPKLILSGAGVKHNAKFLSDYVSGDKEKFIKKNLSALTELNTSGFLRRGVDPLRFGDISSNFSLYAKDTLRFIAHAGGAVEGIRYTNSKEALDKSYKKGFRLFELDILKTSDDVFVAAHDWKNWAEITQYKGVLPPSYRVFLQSKIHGKYTPMGIEEINAWFTTHEDAVLVTDKTNDPVGFSSVFVDKNRLMMELFDMKAVSLGLDSKIMSSMPSQSVLEGLSVKELEKLIRLGVKDVVFSRTLISKNPELIDLIKIKGLRSFVYHVNFESFADEMHVVKYELDNVYGLYADDWSFGLND